MTWDGKQWQGTLCLRVRALVQREGNNAFQRRFGYRLALRKARFWAQRRADPFMLPAQADERERYAKLETN